MILYELKINRSIWIAISPFAIITLCFIGFYLWNVDSLNNMKLINDPFRIYIGVLVLVVILGIMTIPQTILFFNYLSISKGVKVEVNNLSKIISVNKNGVIKYYPFSEVVSIDRYRPIRGPYYFDYYYFVVELKDKKGIVITSLMTNDDKLNIDIPNHLELATWWPIIKYDRKNILNVT